MVDSAHSNYSSLNGVLFSQDQTFLILYPPGRTGSFIIPPGSLGILPQAFESCDGLTSVTIPDSVTSTWDGAFGNGIMLSQIYFKGNAPINSIDSFAYAPAKIYYLEGTTGWERIYAGRPTVLWNPLIETADASFGLQSNSFGFNIAGGDNEHVKILACTNLAEGSWKPVITTNLTAGSVYFSDPDWMSHAARYYRLDMP